LSGAYVFAVRLPKEILVLLVLLVVMIAGVSWYVIDRRAKMRAPKPAVAPARP
jgi:hypothetical protein